MLRIRNDEIRVREFDGRHKACKQPILFVLWHCTRTDNSLPATFLTGGTKPVKTYLVGRCIMRAHVFAGGTTSVKTYPVAAVVVVWGGDGVVRAQVIGGCTETVKTPSC